MTFTYTDTVGTDRDRIRFCIGDTVSSVAMFSDEEIDAAYAQQGDNWFKAVGILLRSAANSPGALLALHDASGRTFTMSQLVSMLSTRADGWIGRR